MYKVHKIDNTVATLFAHLAIKVTRNYDIVFGRHVIGLCLK